MWLKAIKLFKTETPVTIYHMLNSAHHTTIISELTKILQSAKDREMELDPYYEWADVDIPQFSLRLNVPKIPGQDTLVFQGCPQKVQWYRKAIHVECDGDAVKMVHELVVVGKCSR